MTVSVEQLLNLGAAGLLTIIILFTITQLFKYLKGKNGGGITAREILRPLEQMAARQAETMRELTLSLQLHREEFNQYVRSAEGHHARVDRERDEMMISRQEDIRRQDTIERELNQIKELIQS